MSPKKSRWLPYTDKQKNRDFWLEPHPTVQIVLWIMVICLCFTTFTIDFSMHRGLYYADGLCVGILLSWAFTRLWRRIETIQVTEESNRILKDITARILEEKQKVAPDHISPVTRLAKLIDAEPVSSNTPTDENPLQRALKGKWFPPLK